MYIENLMQIGLTEKEASIYLMLLRVGPSPASLIAKRVAMKRVTAYSVLDSLCERGIVTFEITKYGRRYIPHDPECLLYGVEKQYSEIKFRMELAKTCVDKLHCVDGATSHGRKRIIFHYGSATILKMLKEGFNPDFDFFAIYLSFNLSESSVLEKFLSDFSHKNPNKANVCICEKYFTNAKKLFPGANIVSTCTTPMLGGDLFIQGDRMFFIFHSGGELQAMQFDDASYAKFVRGFLLKPYFKGELA